MPTSASKHDALKRIEDEIINELAKAESAKKKELIESKASNTHMKKARKLMIPKIYVADSNKLMNAGSNGSLNDTANSGKKNV